MSEQPKRMHHDMGGLDAGPIDRHEHDYAQWEREVDAIRQLLADKSRRLMTVDELRRGIESIPPATYDSMGYYDKWITSLTAILTEKGVVGAEAMDRKMAEVAERFGVEVEEPSP
ncbi:MAG: nitrile hydratase subunit beta [Alphaproteobacteria bacterium]|nr:nitrile hydratase subunit beta [Alphaproteobacteria bacterium]